MNVLRRHAAAVLDLLWPPYCPACGARAAHAHELFCESCWGALRPAAPEPGVHAAFSVDALFLDVLATSKYRRHRAVGRRLARAAARRLAPSLAPDVLVPVPLTRAKRRERGFNQPEDFAVEIARRTGGAVRSNWLRRRRGGRALAGRAKEEREAGVRGVFEAGALGPPDSRPRVLLVDDVVTTGATAAECARVLTAAGARVGLVVAMGRARGDRDLAPSSREFLARL